MMRGRPPRAWTVAALAVELAVREGYRTTAACRALLPVLAARQADSPRTLRRVAQVHAAWLARGGPLMPPRPRAWARTIAAKQAQRGRVGGPLFDAPIIEAIHARLAPHSPAAALLGPPDAPAPSGRDPSPQLMAALYRLACTIAAPARRASTPTRFAPAAALLTGYHPPGRRIVRFPTTLTAGLSRKSRN